MKPGISENFILTENQYRKIVTEKLNSLITVYFLGSYLPEDLKRKIINQIENVDDYEQILKN